MTDNTNTKMYIHCAIMIAIMIIGFILPAQGDITELGMKVIGVFLGMMWGWLFLDLAFPSILGLCALALAGYGSAKQVFALGIGSEVVLVVLMFTIFTAYITQTGLANTVSQWFMSRKIIQGRPYIFLLCFWTLTVVLGLLVDIYPTIFLLWPVVYNLSKDLNYEKGSKFVAYMCFGVAFIGGVGAVCKPFSMWGLTGYGVFQASMNMEVDFLQYSVYTGIISILMILVYIFIVPKLIGVDFTNFKNGDFNTVKINFTKDQKIASIFTVVLFVALYLPSILPAEWVLTDYLKNSLGTVGIVSIIVVAVALMHRNGKPVVKVSQLGTEGVPFNMIFMVSAIIVIGGALKSPDTGIVDAITNICSPILSSLSPIMFYIALVVIYSIFTQVLPNAALLTIFTPVACTFAQQIGANVIVTFFVGIIVLSSALMTPAASTRSGLVFSNDWIQPKYAYLLGFLAVLLTAIIFLVIGVPLGSMMF